LSKLDRRVQRTRELLQQALITLIRERGYDAVTIQDIVDRANVGRTTFYLHYAGKDELLLGCHEAIVQQFAFGPHARLSRDELLSPDAPPGLVRAYQHLADARTVLYPMFQGKDGLLLLQRLRDWCAREIASTLHAAFDEAESSVPFEVLAHSLAGAQLGLLHWWLQKRQPYPPEQLAQTLHRLQRAAVQDALDLQQPGLPAR
jgi:AcrR family transcriptional regulator